jgi:hypothetical protein
MVMDSDNFAKLWKSHIDKLGSRAGSPKDLISILSARGSQHSYAKANPGVCLSSFACSRGSSTDAFNVPQPFKKLCIPTALPIAIKMRARVMRDLCCIGWVWSHKLLWDEIFEVLLSAPNVLVW